MNIKGYNFRKNTSLPHFIFIRGTKCEVVGFKILFIFLSNHTQNWALTHDFQDPELHAPLSQPDFFLVSSRSCFMTIILLFLLTIFFLLCCSFWLLLVSIFWFILFFTLYIFLQCLVIFRCLFVFKFGNFVQMDRDHHLVGLLVGYSCVYFLWDYWISSESRTVTCLRFMNIFLEIKFGKKAEGFSIHSLNLWFQ